MRISYNLFTQKPKDELSDFASWAKQVSPGQGDDTYRHNGAGEMLVYSAADFEDFRVERPEMPADMETDLEPVIRLLAENRWPWRLHASYDETISRALDVFEKVNRDVPLQGINWFFDHAETISDRSIDRVAALGGGIAVQHRMMFQGEYFIEQYGTKAAENSPPIRRMLEAGLPVGAGTDATRVASYNPWVSLSWLVTSQTLGGTRLYPAANRLDRETALRLWTEANTWFSSEEGKKGQIKIGQLGRPCRAVGRLLHGARGRDRAPALGADGSGRQGRAWRGRLRPTRSRVARADAGLVACRYFRWLLQVARDTGEAGDELRLFATLRSAWSRPCSGAWRECSRCRRPQFLGRFWLRLLGGVAPPPLRLGASGRRASPPSQHVDGAIPCSAGKELRCPSKMQHRLPEAR